MTKKKYILSIASFLIIFVGLLGFLRVVHAGGVGGSWADNACQVTSATFDAGSTPPGLTWGQKITIKGVQYDYWPKYFPPSPLVINIATQNCAGKRIFVQLFSDFDNSTHAPQRLKIEGVPDDSDASNIGDGLGGAMKFIVPSNEQFYINLKTGNTLCNTLGKSPDCSYYIGAGPVLPTMEEADDGSFNISPDDYYSKYSITPNNGKVPISNGKIAYNCTLDSTGLTCANGYPWQYVSDTSDHSGNTNNVTLQGKGTTDSCTGKTGDCYQLYGGLTDIFGALGTKLSSITQANDLGSFLNAIIAIAIGVAGVIAVLRIMYLGVIYMRSDKVTEKLSVRGAIIQTVGGFILLLLVYTILRTINPDLLNLVPNINAISVISPAQYQAITGQPVPTASQLSQDANAAATTAGVPPCAIQAIMQHESKGQANVIGNDANAWSVPNIASRKAFVLSGIKYSGTTFTPNISLYGDKNTNDDDALNAAAANPSDKNLTGLDWRFSHGVGALQITFYPADYPKTYAANWNPPMSEKDTPPLPRSLGGSQPYYPADMLDPVKNTEAGAYLLAQGIKTCGNLTSAFETFNSGGCGSSSSPSAYVQNITQSYNTCLAGQPSS